MRKINTEVLVLGGGATGTGVIRDLAMRGFKAVLVEKRDLSHGTTGRYHGLLHSGGRYVVKDPPAAIECIRENRILRQIMPHCIEDTGGFFVVTPWDDPSYTQRFLDGCQKAGIPVEQLPIREMLSREPLLNPKISQCFLVPDAAADSFLASEANAASAKEYGAEILNYHPVITLLRSENRILGARCHDMVKDEEIEIFADLVVNATGAWAGKISQFADINVNILPGKGIMLALNYRAINTVVNRCKLPADGDIIVPIHTVAVIGTTDVQVPDPDHIAIEPWEVRLMLEEGEKLIPTLPSMRILRAWAGIRPLYQETYAEGSRDISRAFVLLDHQQRDGVDGFITITSGKWTTYRLMAEATVDLVCQQLGVERPCWTHLEALPGSKRGTFHSLGIRLAEIEVAKDFDAPICECELTTRASIVTTLLKEETHTLDDVRREARLGMGPCQGGFCTYRAAGLFQDLRQPPVEQVNTALRDFLQERWKGLLPVLWGSQLRQERLDELIYISVLNIGHLPGSPSSSLASEKYAQLEDRRIEIDKVGKITREEKSDTSRKAKSNPFLSSLPQNQSFSSIDVLIIGAGLSGLVAGWQTASRGFRTKVIAKGWGATHWHAGCVDVLGYSASGNGRPVSNLLPELERLILNNPQHPYALVGLDSLQASLLALQELCSSYGYPLHGSLERNWLLPSAAGAFRPTCLAPETMIAGDLTRRDPMLLVGFEQLIDFYPGLVAANLNNQGVLANSLTLDLPSLRARRFVIPSILARLFETQEFRHELASMLKPRLGQSGRVGFPAVLGLANALEVKRDLETQLGCDVFEIPELPPSIPGIRLHEILVGEIEKDGGMVFDGMHAVSADVEKGNVITVWTEAAARWNAHHAKEYILATGGILGGGLVATPQGHLVESLLDLTLTPNPEQREWFQDDFLHQSGHPIFKTGISVDPDLRPVDEHGSVTCTNLYAVGTGLAGDDFLRQRSFDGIALATAFALGSTLAKKHSSVSPS